MRLSYNNYNANDSCTDIIAVCGSEPATSGECVDSNDGTHGTDNCHNNAADTNNIGGFKWICRRGYSGDGVAYTNIVECLASTDNCHDNACCTDTDGSFGCEYHDRYV